MASITGPRADLIAASPDAGEPGIMQRWMRLLRLSIFLLVALTLPVGEKLLGLPTDYSSALAVLAAVIAVNVVARRYLDRHPTPVAKWMGAAVAFDLVALGAILAFSGGAANPFSALFFVYVALAASFLPTGTAVALVVLAAGVFSSLFALPIGACCPNHPTHGAFSAHLWGMLLAFVLGAGLVTYFMTRVRIALDSRAQENAALRRRAEHCARFESLGTLAAGTAHELATPLGTIFVVASDLAKSPTADPETRAEAARICKQIERCRGVLTRMQGTVANASPHGRAELSTGVQHAVDAWKQAHPDAKIRVRRAAGEQEVPLSQEELDSALGILLDNAQFASQSKPGAEDIEVTLERDGTTAQITVRDHGSGIDADMVDRLGEPFLTTKDPGEGMGLGLYWVRSLMERVQGRLAVASSEGGTTVTLELPSPRSETAHA